MSANPEEVAATTEEIPPTPDGSAEVPKGAESAPAVKEPDEDVTQGVRSRFDELTRYRREAERERDYYRQEVERLRNPPKTEPAVEAPKTLADFQYDEAKFQSYLFTEAQTRAVEAAKKALREEESRREVQYRQADHAERVEKYAKDLPDYDEVTLRPDLAISEYMAETIMESENGPAIAYHLGKNPRLAEQISRLSPLQQAREIGRIEAKLSEKPKPKVSEAPPPAPQLAAVEPAVSVSPDSPDSDKLSDADWFKRRQKQLSRKK